MSLGKPIEVEFRNDSGEEIPGGAVFLASSVVLYKGRKLWKAEKSVAANATGFHLVNGFPPVATGQGGLALIAVAPVPALWQGGTAPVAGEEWGPVADSWSLDSSATGFRVVDNSPNDERVLVVREPGAANEPLPEPSCSSTNEVWVLSVLGVPTGGTFDIKGLTINSTNENIDGIAYNVTAAGLKTALAGHSQLAESDLTVTGGPANFASISITFKGTQASTPLNVVTARWENLEAPGAVGVIIHTYTRGIS